MESVRGTRGVFFLQGQRRKEQRIERRREALGIAELTRDFQGALVVFHEIYITVGTPTSCLADVVGANQFRYPITTPINATHVHVYYKLSSPQFTPVNPFLSNKPLLVETLISSTALNATFVVNYT